MSLLFDLVKGVEFEYLWFYPFFLELCDIEVIVANDMMESNSQEAIDYILMLSFVADNHEFLSREDEIADPVYDWSNSWQPIRSLYYT